LRHIAIVEGSRSECVGFYCLGFLRSLVAMVLSGLKFFGGFMLMKKEWMNAEYKISAGQANVYFWLLELWLPGLFSLVMLACLTHMAYCAFQTLYHPVSSFRYATAAFAL
jgi:hypothetical protein